MLEHLHIDEIKGTGFNKTKSKVKYNKAIGLLDITKGKSLGEKGLRVNRGDFLTYAELKEKIQTCFENHNVKATAKATNIKLIFNVKRTTRNGEEGFLIGYRV